ncbi:MAG: hypothetical protein KAI79_00990 [Bacteroidales bacterium]|nr:hypothetical protein [Bacteroidales bacterium]
MKTNLYLKVIVLLVFSFIATNPSFAQSEEVKTTFNARFPSLVESVRAQTLSGTVDASKTSEIRELNNNLDAGLQDMSSFEIDPKDPVLVFFEKKDFKGKIFKKEPQRAHDELVTMMELAKNDLRDFMADKTQFGIDPRTAQRTISLFIEFKKQNHFDEAYAPWTYSFLYSPRAHKAIYTTGESIIQGLIEKESNAERKENLVDTLMIMYDQRIKYFNQEGYVLGRKAVNLLKYRPAAIIEADNILEKSITLETEKSSPAVMLVFMQTTAELFKRETKDNSGAVIVDAAKVIKTYNTLSDLVTKALDASSTEKESDIIKMAQKGIELHFANSGAANCEALIAINEPKFAKEENKQDTAFLINTLKLLNRQGCDESELHFEMSKQLYSVQPSALAAGGIATRYLKQKNYENAIKYYTEALDKCQNPESQAKFNYQMAYAHKEMGKYSQARTYARKAISLKADFGQAYIMIAMMYAASEKSCGSNSFEQAQVYWVAVDMLNKAKNADPSIAAQANKYINSYKPRYPNKEEAFMHSVTAGKTVKVGCWIQSNTKARF